MNRSKKSFKNEGERSSQPCTKMHSPLARSITELVTAHRCSKTITWTAIRTSRGTQRTVHLFSSNSTYSTDRAGRTLQQDSLGQEIQPRIGITANLLAVSKTWRSLQLPLLTRTTTSSTKPTWRISSGTNRHNYSIGPKKMAPTMTKTKSTLTVAVRG